MNEVRLIDANALKEDLRQYFTKGEALYQILTIIDTVPTIDLIKCPDCRFYHKKWHSDKRMKEKGYWCCWCDCHDDWVGGTNGFCSLAEKQGEEKGENE